jgi:cytochrome b6-f complex iron-sulfur subunit
MALAGLGWLALTATGVACLAMLQRFAHPDATEEPDPLVALGPIDRYATAEPGSVFTDHRDAGVWVLRTPEGVAVASTRCTHLGCTLAWQASERRFRCPCHGSVFSSAGINLAGPAPTPLVRYRVIVRDGELLADRSRVFRKERDEWERPEAIIRV